MNIKNKINLVFLVCLNIYNIFCEKIISDKERCDIYCYNTIAVEYENFQNLSTKEIENFINKKDKSYLKEILDYIEKNINFLTYQEEKKEFLNLSKEFNSNFKFDNLFKIEEVKNKNYVPEHNINYVLVKNLNFIQKLILWNLFSNNIENLFKNKSNNNKDEIYYLSSYPIIEQINNDAFEKINLKDFIRTCKN